MIFTSDELEITRHFRTTRPWTGNYETQLDKWHTYLINMCTISGIPVPELQVARTIEESLNSGPRYNVEQPHIFINNFSVRLLLPLFYNYRATIKGLKKDPDDCCRFSEGLFYSVWPEKIQNAAPCCNKPSYQAMVGALEDAMQINPDYKQEINKCDCKKYQETMEEEIEPFDSAMDNMFGAPDIAIVGGIPNDAIDFLKSMFGLTGPMQQYKKPRIHNASSRMQYSIDKCPETEDALCATNEELNQFFRSFPGNAHPEFN